MKTGARIRSALSGAVLLLVIAVLSGCGAATGTEGSDAGEPTVVDGVAELDPAIEQISTPIDQYGLSTLDSRIIDYATLLGKRNCLKDRGLSFEVVKPFDSFDDPPGGNVEKGGTPNRRWGLWSVESAAKWGYDFPPPNAAQKELQRVNAIAVPVEQQTAYDECFEYAVRTGGVGVGKLFGPNGDTISYRALLHTDAMDTDAGKKAYADWEACLDRQGLSPDPKNPFSPAGLSTMNTEEQINTAILDATCKQDTEMVQRLADIDSAYEQQFIDENEAALVAWRQEIDAMVVKAKKIIRANAG